MSAPGNTLITTGLGVLMLVVVCYVGGRLHQWYKHTFEREEAFREGYDKATRSLFSLATKTSKNVSPVAKPAESFQPGIARGAAAVPIGRAAKRARHRADDKRTLPPTHTDLVRDMRKSA